MFESLELPTEDEITILIDAIAAKQRLTWAPVPRDTFADDSGDDYDSHAPWFANCPDRSSILETLLKFRVPHTALRTGKTYPPPKVRDVRLREQFVASIVDMVSVFNASVPTPSLSAFVNDKLSSSTLPASSPARVSAQHANESPERPTPNPHVETLESTSTQIPSPFPASSPYALSRELGDRLSKFLEPAVDSSPYAPHFSASSPTVRSAVLGDRLPNFSEPSETSFASTPPRRKLSDISAVPDRGPSVLQHSDQVPGRLFRVVDHSIGHDANHRPVFSFVAARPDDSQFVFLLDSWPLVRLERAWRSYVHGYADLHPLLGLSSFVHEILVPHTGPEYDLHFILSLNDGTTISLPAGDIGIMHLHQWPAFLRANMETFPQLGMFPPYLDKDAPKMLAVAPLSIRAVKYRGGRQGPMSAQYLCSFSDGVDEHWPNEWELPPSPELFSTAVWQNFVIQRRELEGLLFLSDGYDNVNRADPSETRDVPLSVTERARDHLPLFVPHDLGYRTDRAEGDLEYRRPFGSPEPPVLHQAPAPSAVAVAPAVNPKPIKLPKPNSLTARIVNSSPFNRDAIAASNASDEAKCADSLLGTIMSRESVPMEAILALNMSDRDNPQPFTRAPHNVPENLLPPTADVLDALHKVEIAVEHHLPNICSAIRSPISSNRVPSIAFNSGFLSAAVQTQLLTMVKGASDRLRGHRVGLRLLYAWLCDLRARKQPGSACRPASPDPDSSADDEDDAHGPRSSVYSSEPHTGYQLPSGPSSLVAVGSSSPHREPQHPAINHCPNSTPSAADPLAPALSPPASATRPSRTEFVNAHSSFSPMTAVDVSQVVRVYSDLLKFAALVDGMSPVFARFVDISLWGELETTHASLYTQGLVRSPPLPTLTNCSIGDFKLILCEIVGPTTVAAFCTLFLTTGSKLIRCSKPGVPSVADFTEMLSGFVMLEILVNVLGNKLGRASSLTSDRSGEPSMVYTGGSIATSFPLMILSLLGPAISPALDILHTGHRKFPNLHLDPRRWQFSTDSAAYLVALKSLVLLESQGSRTQAFGNARYEVAQAIAAPAAPPTLVPPALVPSNPPSPAHIKARFASFPPDYDRAAFAADWERVAPYIDPSNPYGSVEYPPYGDYRSLNSIMPARSRETLVNAPTAADLNRMESELLAMRHRLFGISGSGSVPDGRTADGRRDRNPSSRAYDDRSRDSRSSAHSRDDRSRDAQTSDNTRHNRVRIAPLESRPACYSWSKNSECRKGSDCTFSHDSITCLEYLRSELVRTNPHDPGANVPPAPKSAPFYPRGPSPSTLGSFCPDFSDHDDFDDHARREDGFREAEDVSFLDAIERTGSSATSE